MGCDHDHCHVQDHDNEEKEVEKKNTKRKMLLYIISLILFTISFIPVCEKYQYVFHIVVIILAGYDLIINGIKNIFKLNFTEDTLMTIAVIAAFVLGEYPESSLVILLYKLGEFLEQRAVSKSKSNIEEIVKIKAETTNLLDEKEEYKIVRVEEVNIGDKILIKPGEKVPVDAKVIKGESSIDTSVITGESRDVFVKKGSELLSGSINLSGALVCEVIRDYENSTASQIVDLVYEANNNKGKTEKFITKFSKIYTPTVIVIALFIAVFPAILGTYDFRTWILRALVFLVASCPCSLVISVPLSFFACIGAISKKGMIIKGTKHIEDLAYAKTIAFDKTGTITTGEMQIDKLVTLENSTKDELLSYMVSLEKLSNHPIATAILEQAKDIPKMEVKMYEEIPGLGILGTINGSNVLFGNEKLLEKQNIRFGNEIEKEAIYFCKDSKIIGYITLKEEIRIDSKNIAKDLKEVGIQNIVILTGDNTKAAKRVSEQIGIHNVYSNLLPKDKLEIIESLKKDNKVIFVGDGINDSPVLAASDFGIAMGKGTHISQNTSDSILISNNIGTLAKIIKLAKKSMRIIKFNILFSLVIKAIVLSLGILGIAPIWLAILADTGVTFLTVINSLRIFR